VRRVAIAVITVLACGTRLEGQELRNRTRAPLDSVSQRQHDVLRALRDSLSAVRGAAGEMQRDLGAGSPELVAGRAVRLAGRCARAGAAAREARAILCPGCGKSEHAAARRRITIALDELARSLDGCGRDFTVDTSLAAAARLPQAADTVRAWAPHRIARLHDAFRRYDDVLHTYINTVGIKFETAAPQRSRR
jgi:hypothetical protein